MTFKFIKQTDATSLAL